MIAPVPVVECADHADPLRIGGPDGEACAGHTVDDAKVGSELIVNPPFVALSKKVKIHFAEGGEKRISIPAAAHFAFEIGNDEVVGVDAACFWRSALEQAGIMQALEFDDGLVLLVDRMDLDLFGIG